MGVKQKIKKTLKRIIKSFDSKFMNNALSRRYSRYKMVHGEQIYNRIVKLHGIVDAGKRVKVFAEKEYSVNDIILAQYYQGDYTNYKGMDAAVRLLALEEYHGKNDIGFDLYQRMQSGTNFDWIPRYRELINSYETGGYDADSKLDLSRDLAIRDGSHRLTLAFYHHQEFINAKVLSVVRNRSFDYDFFWKKGFTPDECHLIQRKCDEVLASVNYDFIGVIWPPAMKWADEIIEDMKLYKPEEIDVFDVKDFVLEKGDFVHLFKGLYHTDILDENGMNEKIKLIESYMSEECEEWPIRIFRVHVVNPHISINCKNFSTQSQMIMRIKKTFRERYASRISNYQYDVIMHITDNYLQSKFCRILFEINRDISEFFREAERYEYVTLRAKNSRQHTMFPHKFYFRGNTDILVKYPCPMVDNAYEFAIQHFTNEWIRVEKTFVNGQWKIIVWLKDFMVFQFEFMDVVYGLDREFAQECLDHAISDGVYKYLPESDEIILRILEYIHKPKKTWYETYIKQHIDLLDEERLYRHLDTNIIPKKKVQRLIQLMK